MLRAKRCLLLGHERLTTLRLSRGLVGFAMPLIEERLRSAMHLVVAKSVVKSPAPGSA